MKKAILVLVPLCLMLAGCPLTQSPEEEYGTLVLTISPDGMAAKQFVPPLDMDIAYYDVYGDGPDPATFSYPGITGPTIVESSLVAGEWTITADAFNADDDLIGSGSVVVTVTAGQTVQSEVTVTPLEGTGSLDISITWPAGTVTSPVVTGALTAAGGSPQSISFTLGANSASYSASALDVGWYMLTVQLYGGGVLAWGMTDAVRILKDQLTEAVLSLTAEELTPGEADLTITPDMEDPITVSFTGQQPQLPSGTSVTIVATTSADPADTYQWYLRGEPLTGETSSTITIGESLPAGSYRLDLGVTKGNVIGAGSVIFSVLAAPSEIISTNVGESGLSLDIYFYRGPEFTGDPLYTVWVEDLSGNFVQNLFVCNAPGTNIYPSSAAWVARPMSVPYWAHKSCIEDPYEGDPAHDSIGMYLALPSGDGAGPPYPEGPIPADLDAVTGATRQVDFVLQTARIDDGLSQFRVLLEINRSWDYNGYYTSASFNPGGQPSLVYGATVDTSGSERLYVLSLLGSGEPLGADGGLYDTSNCTTALDIVESVFVYVK